MTHIIAVLWFYQLIFWSNIVLYGRQSKNGVFVFMTEVFLIVMVPYAQQHRHKVFNNVLYAQGDP